MDTSPLSADSFFNLPENKDTEWVQDIGLVRSPSDPTLNGSPRQKSAASALLGLAANKNLELGTTCIGSSVLVSESPSGCRGLPHDYQVIGNLQDRLQLEIMSGKKPLALQALNSNTEIPQSEEMNGQIGILLDDMRKLGNCLKSPRIYMFVVTTSSKESLWTIRQHLLWSENAMSIGDLQLLARAAWRGKKREWELTLKTRELNGGAVIEASRMLLSMSFVATSVSPICYGGQIAIRVLWNRKEAVCLSRRSESGLPRTCTPMNGIPVWTPQH